MIKDKEGEDQTTLKETKGLNTIKSPNKRKDQDKTEESVAQEEKDTIVKMTTDSSHI